MSELTVQYLVLERRDPARNMARFYVLTIEPTLFGDTALVREWGRVSAGAVDGGSICSMVTCRPSKPSSPGSAEKPVVVTSSGIRHAWSERTNRREMAGMDERPKKVY
ncbi:WGR domain-containing protein [Bradyrhizobium sp. LM2.3]